MKHIPVYVAGMVGGEGGRQCLRVETTTDPGRVGQPPGSVMNCITHHFPD